MSANLDTLERVATRLGPLKDEVVFVGGAVTGILVTDPGAPEVRMTDDIDAIVEVATHPQYYDFSTKLRAAGFSEDRSEGAPMCRWIVDDGIKVDLMPTDEGILGFSNRWYRDTIRDAVVTRLPGGTEVRVVTAPYFLATKLEAFAGRGGGDFMSHDIEDLIAVVDGRPELLDEVRDAPQPLKQYLSERIAAFLRTDAFLDCVPGHLPSDEASQQRVSIVLERLTSLAGR